MPASTCARPCPFSRRAEGLRDASAAGALPPDPLASGWRGDGRPSSAAAASFIGDEAERTRRAAAQVTMEGALLSAPVDEYLMVFGTGEVGVAEQLLQAGLLRS